MVIKKIAPFPPMLFLWPKEYFNCVCYSAAHTMRWYRIYVILCFWCYVVDPYITCHLSVALFFLPFDKIFGLLYTHTHHHPAPNCPWTTREKKNKDIKSWNWIFNEVTTATHIGSAGGPLTNGMIHAAAECFQHPPLGQSLGNQRARCFGYAPSHVHMGCSFHQWQPSSYEKLT